ncbi:hypothetical protein ACIP25_38540 [Streptomyces massasporeus]|uniref:hypothetical protein n=1 Tax=Streptomyces massasporeus TaxID=67324 RepID=UPI0037F54839
MSRTNGSDDAYRKLRLRLAIATSNAAGAVSGTITQAIVADPVLSLLVGTFMAGGVADLMLQAAIAAEESPAELEAGDTEDDVFGDGDVDVTVDRVLDVEDDILGGEHDLEGAPHGVLDGDRFALHGDLDIDGGLNGPVRGDRQGLREHPRCGRDHGDLLGNDRGDVLDAYGDPGRRDEPAAPLRSVAAHQAAHDARTEAAGRHSHADGDGHGRRGRPTGRGYARCAGTSTPFRAPQDVVPAHRREETPQHLRHRHLHRWGQRFVRRYRRQNAGDHSDGA